MRLAISRFLIWCAGASASVLAECPESERIRQELVGAFVLLTGVAAFFTSTHAFRWVFKDYYLLAALFWGLVIFSLDRYLVAFMGVYQRKDGDHVFNKWLALPRLVLAIGIGVVIALPFDVALFEAQIIREITGMRSQEDCKDASSAYAEAKARKEELNTAWYNEVNGRSMHAPGEGRIARAYKAERDKEESKLSELSTQLAACNETVLEQAPQADFPSRVKALNQLSRNDDTTRWQVRFLSMLLIFIEMCPVLVKLIGGVGIYDLTLYRDKHFAEVELVRKRQNHVDNWESWVEFKALERAAERERIEAEIDARRSVENTVFSKFSEMLGRKMHDLLDQWYTSASHDQSISEVDTHFRDHWQATLNNLMKTPTTKTPLPSASLRGGDSKENSDHKTDSLEGVDGESESKDWLRDVFNKLRDATLEDLPGWAWEIVKAGFYNLAVYVGVQKFNPNVPSLLLGLLLFIMTLLFIIIFWRQQRRICSQAQQFA